MEEKIAIARKIRKQQRWGFKKRGKAHETASESSGIAEFLTIATTRCSAAREAASPALLCPQSETDQEAGTASAPHSQNQARTQTRAGRPKPPIPGTADHHPGADERDPARRGSARPSPPDPGMSRNSPVAASCSPCLGPVKLSTRCR